MLAKIILLTTPIAALTTLALADRPHHAPPKEAIDACSSKASGDACSFTMHDREISGTCAAPPDGSALACRPDHPPGPPPEAVAACAKSKRGDTCSFTHDDHAVSGTCDGPPDRALACRPDDVPPP